MSGCTCSDDVDRYFDHGCICGHVERIAKNKAHEEWKALTYAKLGVLRVIMTNEEVEAVQRFIELGLG